MAADRREAVNLVLNQIFQDEPGITAAETLLEFARRNSIARHHRVSRKDAAEFLRPEGRAQVYKDVAQQWPGKIQKPVEPDHVFDLDGLDLQRQSPSTAAQGGMKHVLLLLDRYSRKLYGRALPNRSAGVTVPAVQDMLREAREDDAKPRPGSGRHH